MMNASVRKKRGTGPLATWIEPLEDRQLLAAALPTNDEQYMLELINRARANPAAEAVRYGIDLNEGLPPGTILTTPKQPLAFNLFLIDSARLHSQDMLTHDFFAHEGSNGSTPQERMAASGYFFDPQKTRGSGENLAWSGIFPGLPNATTTTADLHRGLFVDEGVEGRGHRLNILNPDFKEVGIGILSGQFTSGGQTYNAIMITQDFAYVLPAAFLTGVAYVDNVVADNFYTPGEGRGGVTVTATRVSDNATFTTTTFSTGGYTLALEPGTYTVSASGGGLVGTVTYNNVIIGSTNVKRDFVTAADVLPPAAELAAANITVAGGSSYTFSVTYNDPGWVNVSSIDSNDIRVSGPNGFSQAAAVIGIDDNTNGTPRTVTYQVVPPGGVWSLAHNGTYTVTLQANQVFDLNGNAASANTVLGTFAVAIPDTTPPTATLSVSNVALPGGDFHFIQVTYQDDVAVKMSTIDAFDIEVTNTRGFSQLAPFFLADRNSDQPLINVLYKLTPPGGTWNIADNDTYTVWLRPNQITDTSNNAVPAGALGTFVVAIEDISPPQAFVEVSDVTAANQASVTFDVVYADPAEVAVDTISAQNLIVRGPGDVEHAVTLLGIQGQGTTVVATYRFDAPNGIFNEADNGTYVIEFTDSGVSDTVGNRIPAGQFGQFAVNIDTTPPTLKVSAKAVTRAGGKAYAFVVKYSDAGLVAASTIGPKNVLVTGPKGYKFVASLVSKSSQAPAGVITAKYQIVPPGKTWDAADNGKYTISLRGRQVSDVAGNFIPAQRIAVFTVKVPAKAAKASASAARLLGSPLTAAMTAQSAAATLLGTANRILG